MGITYLEENNQVLVNTDGNLVVVGVGLLDLLPLVLVGGGRGLLGSCLDVHAAELVDEALHAGLGLGDGLALAELVPADAEGGVGAVEQGLHDGGVLAGVDAGHLDVVGEEGEVLEGDRLVLVVADDVVHHAVWRQGLAVGEVAGEVDARGAVVGGVHDVEVVGSSAAVGGKVLAFEEDGRGREVYLLLDWAPASRMMASSSSSSSMSGMSSSSRSSFSPTLPESSTVRTSLAFSG